MNGFIQGDKGKKIKFEIRKDTQEKAKEDW